MEHFDEGIRDHLRLGALQELFRARADLDRARDANRGDPRLHDALDQIERELVTMRESSRSVFRRRSTDSLPDLLFFERLVLDQLGFDSYEEVLHWRPAARLLDLRDEAYVEFAELELELAEARLRAIESGELDLDWIEGGLAEPGLAVSSEPGPHSRSELEATPLKAWRNPYATPAPPTRRRRYAQLPRLEPDDISLLDLPYAPAEPEDQNPSSARAPSTRRDGYSGLPRLEPEDVRLLDLPYASDEPADPEVIDLRSTPVPEDTPDQIILDLAARPPEVILVPLGGSEGQPTDGISGLTGRHCSRWAGSCFQAMVLK